LLDNNRSLMAEQANDVTRSGLLLGWKLFWDIWSKHRGVFANGE